MFLSYWIIIEILDVSIKCTSIGSQRVVVSDSDRKPCGIDLLDGHSIAIGEAFAKRYRSSNYLFSLEYFYPLVLYSE